MSLFSKLQKKPGSPEKTARELLKRAKESLKEGDKMTALRLLNEAESHQPQMAGLNYLRARCLDKAARYEEALAAAKAELAIDPQNEKARDLHDKLARSLATPAVAPAAGGESQRDWRTSIPRSMLATLQNAAHRYSYRGVPMQKNPFDVALYPLLLWQLKPRTIIEIGSKSGGSALWFGDMLDAFSLNGKVHSI